MLGVQIENDAGVALLRPRKKRLVIALDETDGSVDHVHVMTSEIFAALAHEIRKPLAWNVNLGDDFRGSR